MASLQAQYDQLQLRESVNESILARIGGENAAAKLHHQRLLAQRGKENEWRATLAITRDFSAFADLLVHAVLTATGFHRHKRGEWRKHRNVKAPS